MSCDNLFKSLSANIAKLSYHLGDFAKGTGMFAAMHELEKLQYVPREEMRLVQLTYLKKLLEHAYSHTKFYKEYYDQHGVNISQINSVADLSKLPILTKEHVKEHCRELLANTNPVGKYIHITSSGSTGQPKHLYLDRNSYGWRMASTFLAWKYAGFKFGDSYLRLTLTPRKGWLPKAVDWSTRCTYEDLYHFDELKLETIEKLLDTKNFDFIYSYASSAYLLAQYLKSKNKSYHHLKGIITQGELLFPHYRALIEEVFNTRVTDLYGGDGTSISGQCSYGNYHIIDPEVIIEIVDDSGNLMPGGVIGRLLVTDLHNYPMPLIRYELGDLAALLDVTCPCGQTFSVMSQPYGRDTDIIKLSNGTRLIVHVFTVLFSKYSEVKQFQVVELAQDTLQLNLVVTQEYGSETLTRIKSDILAHTKGVGTILENLVDEIPLTQSNKRRFVIAKTPPFAH